VFGSLDEDGGRRCSARSVNWPRRRGAAQLFIISHVEERSLVAGRERGLAGDRGRRRQPGPAGRPLGSGWPSDWSRWPMPVRTPTSRGTPVRRRAALAGCLDRIWAIIRLSLGRHDRRRRRGVVLAE
jgi:hypothetical protein